MLDEANARYLPNWPGQCSTRSATIGKTKTALMITTGTHTRRWVAKKDRTEAPRLCRCGHSTATSTAQLIRGTNNRKHACPWMRNQPVSATTHASRPRPAATDAAATRKVTYAGTYKYGIQSELSTAGCTAGRTSTAAKQIAAPRSDRVQP